VELRDVLSGVGVLELRGDPTTEVLDVTHDSRRCRPGTLFCCVPGATVDGHDFAPAAVAAGASALLVERAVDVAAAQARVHRVRDVMAAVAARAYGMPSHSLRVLGVTGTNGKTTTVHLLEAIARAAGDRPGTIGTLGAHIDGVEVPLAHTTPEATDVQSLLARMRDAGVGTVAMEVSSEGLAQGRADAITFAAACFTNLSQDHLNFHKTMDAYFEAKAALFTPDRTSVAAINVDDDYGRVLIARARDHGIDVHTFGLGAGVDVTARAVTFDRDGSRFELVDHRRDARAPVALSLTGPFNVMNALAAATTALAAGLPFDAVRAGFARPLHVPGRFEAVDAGQPFLVLVDYAHTPDALERVLGAGRAIAGGGRVIVVFGCGGDRDPDKRAPMGAVAARLADEVIITSDNPRSEPPDAIAAAIAAGVASAGTTPDIELDRRAAIRRALGHAHAGDLVVIAGKGHETGQTARGVTVPFDDRAVAREELETLTCG
jgi:UDP-N-acetylmuramoyl-L-alanyl-D-glutamate--2,6-diaminopimelate ligase